jgi:hypothetical protein
MTNKKRHIRTIQKFKFVTKSLELDFKIAVPRQIDYYTDIENILDHFAAAYVDNRLLLVQIEFGKDNIKFFYQNKGKVFRTSCVAKKLAATFLTFYSLIKDEDSYK